MKKLQVKMDSAFVNGLHQALTKLLLTTTPATDDDKLFYAVLFEITLELQKRLAKMLDRYDISFTPAQALSLRMFQQNYCPDVTTYLGNGLHRISNQVDQKYS